MTLRTLPLDTVFASPLLSVVAVALLVIATGGCSGTADDSRDHAQAEWVDEKVKPPTVESMRAAIHSGEARAIRRSLIGLAYVESSDDPVLSFVVALWKRDLTVVTAEELRKTDALGMRIQVANSVAQLYSAHMVELDIAPVIAALRDGIRSENEDAVVASLYGLTDFTTDNDIAQIGNLAMAPPDSSTRVAIAAVETLSVSCAPAAAAMLERIAASDIPREVRDALMNFPKEVTAYRNRRCGR